MDTADQKVKGITPERKISGYLKSSELQHKLKYDG